MTDYIKREDAENKLAKIVTGDNFKEIEEDTRKSVAKHFFADIPSADVVEVVHCKDCEDSLLNTDLNLYCPHFDHFVDEDFYCKHGEASHD